MKIIFYTILFALLLTITVLKAENHASGQIIALNDSAENAFNRLDTLSIHYATKALKLAEKENDLNGKAISLLILGKSVKIFGIYLKSVEYLNSSLSIFEQLNNKSKLAETLTELGETYRAAANRTLALDVLYKGYRIFNEQRNLKGLAKAANRLAAVYYEIFYDRKNEKSSDTLAILDSIKKYISISNDISFKNKLYKELISNNNILGALFDVNNREDSSLSYLNSAKNMSLENHIPIELPIILGNISRVYFKKKDYSLSIYYSKIALDTARKYNILIYIKLSHEMLCNCYQVLGDFKTAFMHQDTMRRLQLELYSNDINIKTFLIQSNYEKEKNEDEIQDERTEIIYLSIVGGLLILFAGIIIIVLLSKHKFQIMSNKELTDLNQLISQQKEKLEDLNKTKDKFFSIIAHDLRNPIGGFQNITEVLLNDYDDLSTDEKKEFLSLMRNSSKQLYNLLENLLIWSRAQRGQITFKPDYFELKYLIRNTVDLLTSRALEKKIDISIDIPEDISMTADVNMLTTVLRNLISNSIKFTNQNGHIKITASEKQQHYEICVSDDGIGIPKENLEKLFNLEVSYSTLGTNKETGTGLGLIISKEFINIHGGEIFATSENGKGSKFTFTIPQNII